MSKITSITGQEILDSRQKPTLAVTVKTDTLAEGYCFVPAGASTGAREALALPLPEALAGLKEIADLLVGQEVSEQDKLDQLMIDADGTENKSRLGGNAMIGASIAIARAAASENNQELFQYLKPLSPQNQTAPPPHLFMNLINGGAHAPYGSAIQEYQVIPQTNDIRQALAIGRQTFAHLETLVAKRFAPSDFTQGDEGGLAINDPDPELPLELLTEAVTDRDRVKFGLDAAANSFYRDGQYQLADQTFTTEQLSRWYQNIFRQYSLFGLEDPFAEEDFTAFANLKKHLFNALIIGDDLTVTKEDRLQQAIEADSINSLIIKPNQIGTLTETINTINLAHTAGIKTIASHRSGETTDTFIADIAYAFGCFGLKAGAPDANFRDQKYKRLLAITTIDGK
ncbi:MAG: phosphopyruvate hydratase [Candidatus Paceibacterota bacterium]